MRKYRIIINTLAWLVIISQAFTLSPVYADSLATPKLTHPDANQARAISNLAEFEVCYGERLLYKGEKLSSVNSVLKNRFLDRKKVYLNEPSILVRENLKLGQVEFISYDREKQAGVFRFKGKPDNLYTVALIPRQGKYSITLHKNSSGSASQSLAKTTDSQDEPLTGHGFSVEDVNKVKLTAWSESGAFRKVMDELEDILKARAPDNLKELLFYTLSAFKEGRDGRQLGYTPARYKDPAHYYLGFGTSRSICLASEFLDEESPLSKFAAEELFHELLHAAMDISKDDSYIESETANHITSLRLAAQFFWGLPEEEALSLSPNMLEHHSRNSLGDAIRLWKTEQQDIRDAVLNNKPLELKKMLVDALKRIGNNPSKLFDILAVCDAASDEMKRHPIQSRYPLLMAVTLLNRKQKLQLVKAVKQGGDAIADLKIADSVLLMLEKKVRPDWLGHQAPNLKGRTVWQVASEIWNPGGGLGRVMQFEAFSFRDMLGQCAGDVRLRTIEPHYAYGKDGVPLDYDKILGAYEGKEENRLKEVDTFEVTVGDETAIAVCSRALNQHGIESYIIKLLKRGADGSLSPYYTEGMYLYRGAEAPAAVPIEDFSAFFSAASLELVARIEAGEKKASEEASSFWNYPVVYFNDGQLGLAPLFRRAFEHFSNNPILKEALVAYKTHTYPNRVFFDVREKNGDEGYGIKVLKRFGIPEKYWEYFTHVIGEELSQETREVADFTSAGLRSADWQAGVSAKQADDVSMYDDWGKWKDFFELVAITNGDYLPITESRFAEAAREALAAADIESLTPMQVFVANRRAKENLNAFLIKRLGDKYIFGISPDKPVLSYSGRGVDEKAGRNRALSNSNIITLVKMGVQVVIGFNVQSEKHNRDELDKLAEELREAKSKDPDGYPGNFIFVPDSDIEIQRLILAASDAQVQDSDPRTEAAGYTESNIKRCAGLQIAPPWPEGILQAGIPFNFNKLGEGATIIPEITLSESDLKKLRRGAYDPELNKRVSHAYLESYKKLFSLGYKDEAGLDENILANLRQLSHHQANAIKLSRVFDAWLTVAEEMRQWSGAIEKRFPRPIETPPEKRVVMLISGGESPGVNDYFSLMAKSLAKQGCSVEAVRFGLDGLVRASVEFDGNRVWIDWGKSENILHAPGAFEGTARVRLDDAGMQALLDNLKSYCKTLVVIGGNDHLGEAEKIAKRLKSEDSDMAVVALPKTIDRDTKIYPIGADTAARNANKLVLRAAALPGSGKCVVVQMMGRDMGYFAVRAGDMKPKVRDGYTDAEINKMDIVRPTVATLVPNKPVPLSDVIDAVRVRMKKYGAATLVISEGFRLSRITRDSSGVFKCDSDKLLEGALEDKLLSAKLANLSTDEQGNPNLSGLVVADFLAEVLARDEELKLIREENLLLENPNYSFRASAPNSLDRAVADKAIDLASRVISDPDERAKAINAGGVCIAAKRTVSKAEDVEVSVIPLSEATGKVGLDDSGLYTDEELSERNVIGYASPTDNLPDMPETESPAHPAGYNREHAIMWLNSQAESASEMQAKRGDGWRRPNICVIARPDADDIISDLKYRKAVSRADEYIMERIGKATVYIPALEPVSLLAIIRKSYEAYNNYHMLNLVLAGNIEIDKNDALLARLMENPSTKDACGAIVGGARHSGGDRLIFGRRLADLISMVLSSSESVAALAAFGEKAGSPMTDIRTNILGESLNLLPGENGQRIKAIAASVTGAMPQAEPAVVMSDDDINAVVEASSDAGEDARKAAEAEFPGEMHLVFVRKAIPDIQQSTTIAMNVLNLCREYYADKLEGYTVDIVDDHKAAMELLARNPNWSRNDTIIGLVDKESLEELAGELEAGNMTDKAKILSMQKADDGQFVPIKPFFDLMAAIVRINRPLDRVEDRDLIDYIKELLIKIGTRDIDRLTEVLASADFHDPIRFARDFIIRLLPPARKFDTTTLKKLYQASKLVVESL
ncbi:MAG: 6-phosphofructokinase [Candidatus Omnitrophota bacterium]